MNLWIVMLIAGLVTFGIRLSFILIFGSREIPAQIQRILRLVPAAVLPAIIFPEVLIKNNILNISLTNFRIYAAIIAVLVSWKTKNVFLTILAGMIILILLQTFIPS
jgi:branched-subunit amino acid transport protein